MYSVVKALHFSVGIRSLSHAAKFDQFSCWVKYWKNTKTTKKQLKNMMPVFQLENPRNPVGQPPADVALLPIAIGIHQL